MAMDYAQSIEYLSSLRRLGVQPGRERLAAVLARLGQPQTAVPALHIAGTNGKGSTSAFAAHLLVAAAQAQAAGGQASRVGLYTSPHLSRVRERIQISDGRTDGPPRLHECEEGAFAGALSQVRAASEASPAVELTFFEVLTAAAFLLFAEAGVDVAVIETGLGGRLDATRLCDARVTVVTGIALDHTEILGSTLTAIAYEKAGIFRPGVPALVACEDAGALAVLRQVAGDVGAPLSYLARDGEVDGAGPRLGDDLAAMPPLPEDLAALLPLVGAHQRRNAALALAAVRSLPGALGTAAHGADVSRAGLSATRWPGRMERLWPRDALQATAVWARIDGDGDGDGGGSNLDGHAAPPLPEVWLDGAHNPQGAGVLADLLGTLRRGRPLTVVLGVVGDKAAAEMAAPLALATQVVLTEPPSPRALPAAGLREALDGHLPAAVWVEPDCYAALRHALRVSPPGGMLVVYGSLFLVGAIRARWLGETVDAIALQDPRAVRATGATHRREN